MGAPLTIISPPQFRDKLQDLLPTLPNADEYFLLRWLRGEAGRVREAERERGKKSFREAGGTLESELPSKSAGHKKPIEPQFLHL